MRLSLLASALLVGASASAQSAIPGKPLGVWSIEYDHTVSTMHSEPRKETVHGRITLRAVGDSVLGELALGDSATADRSVLRGIAHNGSYALHVEEAPAAGFGVFFSALGAAMDWLRENVHGIHPVAIRFDLTPKGDSMTGSRTATGGMSSAPRISPVMGKRIAVP